jgi:hypothetical protein
MSTDHISTLEQALSNSEARYIKTQRQIEQPINGFQQLQQILLQQQKPPSPTPKTPLSNPTPQVPSNQAPSPALPSEFDEDRSKGPAFLRSCQTYILLCLKSFCDDQTKII